MNFFLNKVSWSVCFLIMLGCSLLQAIPNINLVGGTPAVFGQFASTEFGIGCTGVKIGPRHFLTAAHCVHGSSGTSLDVYFGVGPLAADFEAHRFTSVTVQDVSVHWLVEDGNDDDKSSDLAIFTIKEDTPAPIASIRRTPLRIGERVILNGWGCQDFHDFTSPDWRKFQLKFSEKIVKSVSEYVVEVPGIDADGIHASTGCSGDSGGPVYVRNSDNTLSVVGINHAIKLGSLDAKDVSLFFERIDAQAGHGTVWPWIHEVLKR